MSILGISLEKREKIPIAINVGRGSSTAGDLPYWRT